MAEANRCGATRTDAPDKPCIRPAGHPPLHADADGEAWGDPVARIREAREQLLARLAEMPSPLPRESVINRDDEGRYAVLHRGPNQMRNRRIPIDSIGADVHVASYIDGFVGTLVYRHSPDEPTASPREAWYNYVECVPFAVPRDEPEPELVMPPGKLRLASVILVDRDENGAPRITIDGQQLPWYTQGIVTPAPSLNEMPTITITIPAEKVTMANEPRIGWAKREAKRIEDMALLPGQIPRDDA